MDKRLKWFVVVVLVAAVATSLGVTIFAFRYTNSVQRYVAELENKNTLKDDWIRLLYEKNNELRMQIWNLTNRIDIIKTETVLPPLALLEVNQQAYDC